MSELQALEIKLATANTILATALVNFHKDIERLMDSNEWVQERLGEVRTLEDRLQAYRKELT